MAGSAKGGNVGSSRGGPQPVPAIIVGGLIAGAIDLAYAILVYSPRQPIVVPQTIASGVLGTRAFGGGPATAILGVVLHLLIALSAAAVYYVASRRLPFLLRRAVLSGLAYGAAVYYVMHVIVLPLSAAPHSDMPLSYQLCEFVEHMIGVGLPIALSVRHFAACATRTRQPLAA
jgi:uncharacterized membrane protein YagU involved in acid resistance